MTEFQRLPFFGGLRIHDRTSYDLYDLRIKFEDRRGSVLSALHGPESGVHQDLRGLGTFSEDRAGVRSPLPSPDGSGSGPYPGLQEVRLVQLGEDI